MSMIKQNVVEFKRTPNRELNRRDSDWDKTAAAEFKPVPVSKKASAKRVPASV